MPESLKIDPYSQQVIRPTDLSLRTPQARVLSVLCPANPKRTINAWQAYNRPQLALRAGYTTISGTVIRALHGVRPGGKNDPHPGLLARGFIDELILDIDGIDEISYRATHLGVSAYQEYIKKNGELPPLKSAASCTNNRYKKNKKEPKP
jgi:hypothetical protein